MLLILSQPVVLRVITVAAVPVPVKATEILGGDAVDSVRTASGEASTTGQPAAELAKAVSPKRKLSIRGFKRSVIAAGIANGEAPRDSEAGSAFSDAVELQSRTLSVASELLLSGS